jgi:hypothetical protein
MNWKFIIFFALFIQFSFSDAPEDRWETGTANVRTEHIYHEPKTPTQVKQEQCQMKKKEVIDEFIEWIEENGGMINSDRIEVRTTNNHGFGVFVKR